MAHVPVERLLGDRQISEGLLGQGVRIGGDTGSDTEAVVELAGEVVLEFPGQRRLEAARRRVVLVHVRREVTHATEGRTILGRDQAEDVLVVDAELTIDQLIEEMLDTGLVRHRGLVRQVRIAARTAVENVSVVEEIATIGNLIEATVVEGEHVAVGDRVGDTDARADLLFHPLANLADRELIADTEGVITQSDVEHHSFVLPPILQVVRALGIEVVVPRTTGADLPIAVGLVRPVDLEEAHVVIVDLDTRLHGVLPPPLGEVDLARIGLGFTGREGGIVARDHEEVARDGVMIVEPEIALADAVVLPRLLPLHAPVGKEAVPRQLGGVIGVGVDRVAPGELEHVGLIDEVRRVLGRVVILVGVVDLGRRPTAAAHDDLALLGRIAEGLDVPDPTPLVVVLIPPAPIVDQLGGELVVRARLVCQLGLDAHRVRLPVADRDEVQELGPVPPLGRIREVVLVGALGGKIVGEVLDRRGAAEAQEDAVQIVEGIVGLTVVVGLIVDLPFELLAAFLGLEVDDPRLRVTVLGVEASKDGLGVLHRQGREAHAAADQRVAHRDAVDLVLDLARPAAAEVNLLPLRDDSGLEADRFADLVDREAFEILAADGVGSVGLLLLNDLLRGGDLDLRQRSDVLFLHLEVDRLRRAGGDGDRFHGRALVSEEHAGDGIGAGRQLADGVATVLAAHRAPARADENDVGVG